MTRPKISIAGMLLVIVVVALGLAAIKSGSPGWAGGLLSFTFFALLSSLMAIIFTRGSRRVYWFGFAFMGWMYVLFSLHPSLREQVGSNFLAPCLHESVEQWMHPNENAFGGPPPGGPLLGTLDPQTPESGFLSLPVVPGTLASARTGFGGFGGGGGMAGGVGGADVPYLQILWSLEALLWAYLGGWVARYFARPTP